MENIGQQVDCCWLLSKHFVAQPWSTLRRGTVVSSTSPKRASVLLYRNERESFKWCYLLLYFLTRARWRKIFAPLDGRFFFKLKREARTRKRGWTGKEIKNKKGKKTKRGNYLGENGIPLLTNQQVNRLERRNKNGLFFLSLGGVENRKFKTTSPINNTSRKKKKKKKMKTTKMCATTEILP